MIFLKSSNNTWCIFQHNVQPRIVFFDENNVCYKYPEYFVVWNGDENIVNLRSQISENRRRSLQKVEERLPKRIFRIMHIANHFLSRFSLKEEKNNAHVVIKKIIPEFRSWDFVIFNVILIISKNSTKSRKMREISIWNNSFL